MDNIGASQLEFIVESIVAGSISNVNQSIISNHCIFKVKLVNGFSILKHALISLPVISGSPTVQSHQSKNWDSPQARTVLDI